METDWDTAMAAVAGRTKELLEERGPSSIGFYTSGQLFLEEYYTLALIAHGGIGTNHMDGNTRLCTATAAAALKESFACDGQPGSYTDIDHADVIALYGHNMAETQTVLWTRILDRLAGPNPPQIICVDPRLTPVARAATVHLAPRPGTNVMLMNALLHEIIENDWVDHDYVDGNTVGFDELAEAGCGLSSRAGRRGLRRAGRATSGRRPASSGHAERLLSTVLQGFYQSHQATAAAVQVNNINLLRGMLGKPGCGILQMNGQPTAQNTRECGADGDLPGFRNWSNDSHVADLAQVWNIEPMQIPHYGAPTHLMQIMRYVEDGSIRFLYVSGTNPAVSLPELGRIRQILSQERLFLVVQDIFLSETAQLADVVLPAATWGEKTGTFTNADRTVHLSEKAVDPPGEARPDLDIFLDYADRLGLQDKDGAAAGQVAHSGGGVRGMEGVQRRAAVRLHRPVLRQAARRQRHPVAVQRRASGRHRAPLRGRDVLGRPGLLRELRPRPGHRRAAGTHGVQGDEPGRPGHAQGRRVPAAARAADRRLPVPADHGPYALPLPHPDEDRSRTPAAAGRARGVGRDVGSTTPRSTAGPKATCCGSARRAARSRRRLRISGIRPGVVFLPFHYGYWDTAARLPAGVVNGRAANELTITDWDPASKQPLFKSAAAKVERMRLTDGEPSAAPTTTGSAPVRDIGVQTRGGDQAVAVEELDRGGP